MPVNLDELLARARVSRAIELVGTSSPSCPSVCGSFVRHRGRRPDGEEAHAKAGKQHHTQAGAAAKEQRYDFIVMAKINPRTSGDRSQCRQKGLWLEPKWLRNNTVILNP